MSQITEPLKVLLIYIFVGFMYYFYSRQIARCEQEKGDMDQIAGNHASCAQQASLDRQKSRNFLTDKKPHVWG